MAAGEGTDPGFERCGGDLGEIGKQFGAEGEAERWVRFPKMAGSDGGRPGPVVFGQREVVMFDGDTVTVGWQQALFDTPVEAGAVAALQIFENKQPYLAGGISLNQIRNIVHSPFSYRIEGGVSCMLT